MIKSVFFLTAFIISSYAHAGVLGDVDGDGQVGLNEAIYSLQALAGMRPPLSVATEPEVISGYLETSGAIEQAILTVPLGKIFVLTDLVVSFSSGYHKFSIIEQIDEVKTTKLGAFYSATGVNSLSFKSGIPFSSEAIILIRTIEGAGKVAISGYLI